MISFDQTPSRRFDADSNSVDTLAAKQPPLQFSVYLYICIALWRRRWFIRTGSKTSTCCVGVCGSMGRASSARHWQFGVRMIFWMSPHSN